MKNEYEWASKKRSHKILAILIPTIAFEIRLFASGRVSRVKKITLKINAKKTAIFEYDGIHCNRCVGKLFKSTTICRGQLKKNMDTRKIKFRQTERKFREFFTSPIDYRISQWVSGALLQMESKKVIVPVVVGNQKSRCIMWPLRVDLVVFFSYAPIFHCDCRIVWALLSFSTNYIDLKFVWKTSHPQSTYMS